MSLPFHFLFTDEKVQTSVKEKLNPNGLDDLRPASPLLLLSKIIIRRRRDERESVGRRQVILGMLLLVGKTSISLALWVTCVSFSLVVTHRPRHKDVWDRVPYVFHVFLFSKRQTVGHYLFLNSSPRSLLSFGKKEKPYLCHLPAGSYWLWRPLPRIFF